MGNEAFSDILQTIVYEIHKRIAKCKDASHVSVHFIVCTSVHCSRTL
jgi:hypothetical protein